MSSNVIAIDGPSYVGKSTISKSLAEVMGRTYINTGHMYRAIAKAAITKKVSQEDGKGITELARSLDIRFQTGKRVSKTVVNGEDWTHALEAHDVIFFASKIASIPELRQMLTDRQRGYAKHETIIMEGRDIGSVVFPDAEWKFFITASLDVRARRMHKVMDENPKKACPDYRTLIPKVKELDEADMKRTIAPLKIARDAMVYDNSDSPSEMQDALILQYYINHWGEILNNSTLLKQHAQREISGKHS